MFAVTVTFTATPDGMAAFLPLVRAQAANSLRLEPECHRFDFWTDPARPDQVFLYEIYTDAAAFDAHLQSAHFKIFARETAPLVADKQVTTWATKETDDE